jgi:chemotaxis protein methyltransferase CheR
LNEGFRDQLMRLVALLEQRHGIGIPNLEPPAWLEARLTRAVEALAASRHVDVTSLRGLLNDEPDLLIELANAVCVGESRFYRDAAQWEALRRHVLPGLWAGSSAQPLKALSAGCSTGEEAWTLGMLLCESAPRTSDTAANWEVLGVDRSELALLTARSASYDIGSQQQLPRELSQRFLQHAVEGSVSVVPDLQSRVTFQCHDLTLGVPAGRHSVIVCKNVLSHLGDQAQARLVDGLLRALTDDGILLVARSEVTRVRSFGATAVEVAPNITAFRPH